MYKRMKEHRRLHKDRNFENSKKKLFFIILQVQGAGKPMVRFFELL
jgi:hypothetical protein